MNAPDAILLSSFGVIGSIGAVMLYRNEWVFKWRCELRGTPEYDQLPSYDAMMKRWWVWDIRKFLK